MTPDTDIATLAARRRVQIEQRLRDSDGRRYHRDDEDLTILDAFAALQAENARIGGELERVTRELRLLRDAVARVEMWSWTETACDEAAHAFSNMRAVARCEEREDELIGYEEEIAAEKARATAAEAARDAALGDVERLREVIEPFAAAGRSPPCAPGPNPMSEENIVECIAWSYRDGDRHYRVMMTDFRRAARVLAETAPADGGGADGAD